MRERKLNKKDVKLIISLFRHAGRRKISKIPKQFLFFYKIMQIKIVDYAINYVT